MIRNIILFICLIFGSLVYPAIYIMVSTFMTEYEDMYSKKDHEDLNNDQ